MFDLSYLLPGKDTEVETNRKPILESQFDTSSPELRLHKPAFIPLIEVPPTKGTKRLLSPLY